MAAKTLIIIPAYNEEASLPGTLAKLRSQAPECDVLVVDDGSRDKTASIARAAGVACASLPFNTGIGGAVQTGYIYAWRHGYDIAIQLDADGQHDPNEIATVSRPLEANECDMVIGSRFVGEGENFKSTRGRRLGIWLLSNAIFFSTGVRVRDVTSGFRAVNRRALGVFAQYYPGDYPEPESLAVLLHGGFRVREVPVRMHARQGGHSSIRWFHSGVYMAKLLSLIAAYGLFRRAAAPMRAGEP